MNHADSTGRDIKVGDVVTVKGSNVRRVVQSLEVNAAQKGKDVRATREDGKSQAWSTWSHARTVTIQK